MTEVVLSIGLFGGMLLFSPLNLLSYVSGVSCFFCALVNSSPFLQKRPDLLLRYWDFPCYFLMFFSEPLILKCGSGRASQMNAWGYMHPDYSSRAGYFCIQGVPAHTMPSPADHRAGHLLPLANPASPPHNSFKNASKNIYKLSAFQALHPKFVPHNLGCWPQAFSQAPSLPGRAMGTPRGCALQSSEPERLPGGCF